MDFLDPARQRRHTVVLYVGYVLIAIAILVATVALVYQANGFGVNNRGQVVQNGLVFFSSQPNPANVYLNGTLSSSQTNTRLSIPAGQYRVRISLKGYRDWQRIVNVQGGDVQHFDYPVLFPTNLITKNIGDSLGAAPALVSQSRDRRWLLVQPAGEAGFKLFDLKNPSQAAAALTLPAGLGSDASAWQVVQWADDNQHVLLVRPNPAGGQQYVLLDTSDASKTVDLNSTLNSGAAAVSLIDNKYNQFYLFDSASGELTKASLNAPEPVKVLSGVISFKSYGSSSLLYAAANPTDKTKVDISMLADGKKHLIRRAPAGTAYLMDMAGYGGTPYVVVGASSENAVYVYKDPLAQMSGAAAAMPKPIRLLRLNSPTFVGFSPTAHYVVAENGSQFGVYDVYLQHAYQYNLLAGLDAPQPHAVWMDGNRLTYTSGGKLLVLDYDQANQQILMPLSPNFAAAFSADYHYVYAVAPDTSGAYHLTQTALLLNP